MLMSLLLPCEDSLRSSYSKALLKADLLLLLPLPIACVQVINNFGKARMAKFFEQMVIVLGLRFPLSVLS